MRGRNGAGDENRTHATSLEGWSSTIELRPLKWWAEKDSNLRSASARDLQSLPVDHLGICPELPQFYRLTVQISSGAILVTTIFI